jgi:hypothetical protein
MNAKTVKPVKRKRYDSRNPSSSYDPEDLAALRASRFPSLIANGAKMRFDGEDDASVFFARELDYVKTETYDVQYPELNALRLFPVTTQVDPGAEETTFYGYQKTGMAKIIANYATDLPRADVKGEPTTVRIKGIGDSYGYSVQDMRASRMAGKSLDTRRGESAKYQHDYLQNLLAWRGDPENKIIGILSPENDVPYYVLPAASGSESTKWKDKEPDEIVADVCGMFKQMEFNTKKVERPDTLGIPSDVYIELSMRRIPQTDSSVLNYIKNNVPYDINIESVWELDSDSEMNPLTSQETPTGLALLYKKDERKLSVEIPLPFIQHPVQFKGLEMEIPCESRTAGMILYYPLSVLIAQGVS